MRWVLVVFAPEAILDTLVRLDNISGLILGAVIESHLRVTSSRRNMEVGNYLVWFGSSIHAAQGLLGLHLSTRVCPILNYLALFVWFVVYASVSLCSLSFRLFPYVP